MDVIRMFITRKLIQLSMWTCVNALTYDYLEIAEDAEV
jgi:hypothetical protein